MSEDEERKKKMQMQLDASGADDQETVKPGMGKGKDQKRNRVYSRFTSARAADEDRFKAEMGERSSSKDQTPTQSRRTPLYKKTLTCDDVHTGKLMILPESAGVLLAKTPKRKHGRIMVLFKDNKGVDWEMEATYQQGLSLNWDKFVKEHGLQPYDVIGFYSDDPSSDYYNIDYEKNGVLIRMQLIDFLMSFLY